MTAARRGRPEGAREFTDVDEVPFADELPHPLPADAGGDGGNGHGALRAAAANPWFEDRELRRPDPCPVSLTWSTWCSLVLGKTWLVRRV